MSCMEDMDVRARLATALEEVREARKNTPGWSRGVKDILDKIEETLTIDDPPPKCLICAKNPFLQLMKSVEGEIAEDITPCDVIGGLATVFLPEDVGAGSIFIRDGFRGDEAHIVSVMATGAVKMALRSLKENGVPDDEISRLFSDAMQFIEGDLT